MKLSNIAGFTRKGNTLYAHVYFWPGTEATLGGISVKPKSAKLLASGKNVEFSHTGTQLTFKGLPTEAPDEPVTVIAIEFDSEPRQKSLAGRVIDIITEIEKKQHPAGPE